MAWVGLNKRSCFVRSVGLCFKQRNKCNWLLIAQLTTTTDKPFPTAFLLPIYKEVPRKARPARIRVRLRDVSPPGAVSIALPQRNMLIGAIILAIFFAIFAVIEWNVVSGLFRHSVDDVSDLAFLLFQGFWALGWSVGVLLLGGLTVLFAFYSESARLEEGKLVHIPKLGPLKILIDYELAKIRNVRLEPAGGGDPDLVRVRFDYDGGENALGDAVPRHEGQHLVDLISGATRFVPRAFETPRVAPQNPQPASLPAPAAEPLPLSAESAIALVIANFVPLVGVLLFGWDLGDIMVLYWVESGVIAFYTVLKIAIVGKLAALVAAPFFVGHFGGFMTGHFLLIYSLFLRGLIPGRAPGATAELSAIFLPIWTSIAALFISHGVSFVTNFIGQREYDGASVKALMTAPYNRIVVMHLTLIFGGWIVLLLGMPTGALVILLLLKTAVDLQAHRKEHAVTHAHAAHAPHATFCYTPRP